MKASPVHGCFVLLCFFQVNFVLVMYSLLCRYCTVSMVGTVKMVSAAPATDTNLNTVKTKFCIKEIPVPYKYYSFRSFKQVNRRLRKKQFILISHRQLHCQIINRGIRVPFGAAPVPAKKERLRFQPKKSGSGSSQKRAAPESQN